MVTRFDSGGNESVGVRVEDTGPERTARTVLDVQPRQLDDEPHTLFLGVIALFGIREELVYPLRQL